MAMIIKEDHLSDTSSDDSFEQLKELESSLYSIIHYNNLSEIVDSDLPQGYKIIKNASSNDLVVTLEDNETINVCQSNEGINVIDLQNIEVVSDRHNDSSNQSINTPSDVEIIEENTGVVINISDSDLDFNENNADRTTKIELNISVQSSNKSSELIEEIIICSSDDELSHKKNHYNTPNKHKRKKIKHKKTRNSLESYCPKKWTQSMKKFYSKISSKRLRFDSSKLINKMKESVGPEDWRLCDREFIPEKRAKVRCQRCKQLGHVSRACTERYKPIVCHMCGEIGHVERCCPQSKCLTCGKSKEMFTQVCRKCHVDISKKGTTCTVCKSNMHDMYLCPDLWRGFHSTTDDNSLVVPLNLKLQRVCNNCNTRGHFEFECTDLSICSSSYAMESPEVKNYFAVAQAYNNDKQFSVIMKLQNEDNVVLCQEAGYEFLQNLSNSTQARIELDEPKITVFGSESQCRAVKDSLVSYLNHHVTEHSTFHKHKKKSTTPHKRRKT